MSKQLGISLVGFLLLFCSGVVKATSSFVNYTQGSTANEVRSTITNGSRSYTLQLRDSSLVGARWDKQPNGAIAAGSEGATYALPIARAPSIIQKMEYRLMYDGKRIGVCHFSIQNHLNKPVEYDVQCEVDRGAPHPVTTMKRARSADKLDTVEFLVTN
jgi:hypothetical protein